MRKLFFPTIICLLLAACFTVGCDTSATDTGQARNTTVKSKRYLVERVDWAPTNSRIHTIEVIRDTQTKTCYMVVSLVEGATMVPTACEEQ
jgi:hypothetical protein